MGIVEDIVAANIAEATQQERQEAQTSKLREETQKQERADFDTAVAAAARQACEALGKLAIEQLATYNYPDGHLSNLFVHKKIGGIGILGCKKYAFWVLRRADYDNHRIVLRSDGKLYTAARIKRRRHGWPRDDESVNHIHWPLNYTAKTANGYVHQVGRFAMKCGVTRDAIRQVIDAIDLKLLSAFDVHALRR